MQVVADYVFEMGEREGKLIGLSSAPSSFHQFLGRSQQGLLSIVNQQNEVNLREPICDPRAYAGCRPGGMPQAFPVDDYQFAICAEDVAPRHERPSHPDAIYQRREQPTKLPSVIAGKPDDLSKKGIPVFGLELPRHRPSVITDPERALLNPVKALAYFYQHFCHQFLESAVQRDRFTKQVHPSVSFAGPPSLGQGGPCGIGLFGYQARDRFYSVDVVLQAFLIDVPFILADSLQAPN